jgi:hypothetical protein
VGVIRKDETYEQAVERLCKRNQAKILNCLRQQPQGLTPDVEAFIINKFSYLMDDLKLRTTKENTNGKSEN